MATTGEVMTRNCFQQCKTANSVETHNELTAYLVSFSWLIIRKLGYFFNLLRCQSIVDDFPFVNWSNIGENVRGSALRSGCIALAVVTIYQRWTVFNFVTNSFRDILVKASFWIPLFDCGSRWFNFGFRQNPVLFQQCLQQRIVNRNICKKNSTN